MMSELSVPEHLLLLRQELESDLRGAANRMDHIQISQRIERVDAMLKLFSEIH